MNIFHKLAKARKMLKESGLRQSGNNTYAGYSYFELADFLPRITEIEEEVGLLSAVSFLPDLATLTVYDAEEKEGKGHEQLVFTSPMSTANLKGCYEVQNLGAVQTYIRRYLYNLAYEIVECDAMNATQGKPEGNATKPTKTPVKAEEKKPTPNKATEQKKPSATPTDRVQAVMELIKDTGVGNAQVKEVVQTIAGPDKNIKTISEEQFDLVCRTLRKMIKE